MTTQTGHLERLTQASEWLLRLNDSARSEQDLGDWLAWCDASSKNVEAFEQVQRDWRDLDALKGPSAIRLLAPVRAEKVRPGRATPQGRWILVASLAAIAVTAGLSFNAWNSARSSVRQLAAAITNKTATLPDGSSIVLSARTKVDVDFTGVNRQLNLSPGEAYFKVRQDKQRPFVVRAGEISIAAIGTAFNIRRDTDRIVVTVEEGAVRVSGAGDSWLAQAGYQLTYSPSLRIATLAAVDAAAVMKWRDGELAYVWEPLGAVIADVNRYSNRRIVLKDESLAALRFTGTVFTPSIDDWLKAIQDAYPIRAETSPAGDIILRRNP